MSVLAASLQMLAAIKYNKFMTTRKISTRFPILLFILYLVVPALKSYSQSPPDSQYKQIILQSDTFFTERMASQKIVGLSVAVIVG